VPPSRHVGHGAAVPCLALERELPVRRELGAEEIVVRGPSKRGLAAEAPPADEDVERVVGVVVAALLARRVARVRPLGVVKG